MRKWLLILLAVLVASRAHAQSSGGHPERSEGRPNDAQFWTQLCDSTLDRLEAIALAGNLDVRAAEARVRAASAARRLGVFDLAPTVTTAAGVTRGRLSAAQVPNVPGVTRRQELWDAGLVASWDVDLFGRTRHTLSARTALVDASREDVRDVRLALAAEVALTYLDLRGAQSELAVAQRNATNQRRTLQVTVDRLSAGRGTALDRERATAQLSATLASVPLLEARVDAAIARIGALLGRPAGDLAPALAAPAPVPFAPERAPAIDTAALVRARPDVRAAEREAAASASLVAASRADYLPRLGVAAGVGYTAGRFDALVGERTSRVIVGPVVSWPALDLGRVRARVDAARAAAVEARSRYDQAVLAALADAESALSRYERSRASLAFLQDAADASERGAELARLRFTSGAADFLEVLDAERTLLDAQDRLARGRTDVASAFVALHRALGF